MQPLRKKISIYIAIIIGVFLSMGLGFAGLFLFGIFVDSVVISSIVLLLLLPLYKRPLFKLIALSYESEMAAIFFDSIVVPLALILLYSLDYFIIGYFHEEQLIFSYSPNSPNAGSQLGLLMMFLFPLYYIISLSRASFAYEKTKSLDVVMRILISPIMFILMILISFIVVTFIWKLGSLLL